MFEKLRVKYYLWMADVNDSIGLYEDERMSLADAYDAVLSLEKKVGETDWTKDVEKRIDFQSRYGCGN